jgi:hypothetical protein
VNDVAFGHPTDINTSSRFYVERISITDIYGTYDANVAGTCTMLGPLRHLSGIGGMSQWHQDSMYLGCPFKYIYLGSNTDIKGMYDANVAGTRTMLGSDTTHQRHRVNECVMLRTDVSMISIWHQDSMFLGCLLQIYWGFLMMQISENHIEVTIAITQYSNII